MPTTHDISLSDCNNAASLVWFGRATGTGNIDEAFTIPSSRFAFVVARCHFTAGSGTASVAIGLYSGVDREYDTTLHTETARGTGADLCYDPVNKWAFDVGDYVSVSWTNPASGTMEWGLEIGLTPLR